MMKKAVFLFFFWVLLACRIAGQTDVHIHISNNLLNGNSEELPFWLHANRNGIIEPSVSLLNLTTAEARFISQAKNKNWKYTAGTVLLGGLGDKNYFQVNQLMAGIQYKKWMLTTGLFPDKIVYDGLSSTNGNFDYSNNTRPLPRIRLETDGFIRFTFFPGWLFVNGRYEEGLLDDANRFVQKAHLHHKYLWLGFSLSTSSFLTVGLDHYSMWGGTHPTLGKLPASLTDYFRYILGLPGSDEFIKGDQNLMAGNQLGKYVIRWNKLLNAGELEFYLNHPFTDRMDWSNYKDNLAGIYLKRNKGGKITSVLYEFMYTKYQRVTDPKKINGYEPYFMHGTYRTGLSYQNRMLGTPFAVPLVIKNGINYGTGNNRIMLHHLGMKGDLTGRIKWRTLLSVSKNYGTYDQVYNQVNPGFFDSPKTQVSIMGELTYLSPNDKWKMIFSLAADKGELLPDAVGAQLGIQYIIW